MWLNVTHFCSGTLYMCVSAFYHICPVIITVSYVTLEKTIVPLYHWIPMFWLQKESFGCCNLYLCAVCFSIIAGALTC